MMTYKAMDSVYTSLQIEPMFTTLFIAREHCMPSGQTMKRWL